MSISRFKYILSKAYFMITQRKNKFTAVGNHECEETDSKGRPLEIYKHFLAIWVSKTTIYQTLRYEEGLGGKRRI